MPSHKRTYHDRRVYYAESYSAFHKQIRVDHTIWRTLGRHRRCSNRMSRRNSVTTDKLVQCFIRSNIRRRIHLSADNPVPHWSTEEPLGSLYPFSHHYNIYLSFKECKVDYRFTKRVGFIQSHWSACKLKFSDLPQMFICFLDRRLTRCWRQNFDSSNHNTTNSR